MSGGKRVPGDQARRHGQAMARYRALMRLARAHPGEFTALYQEELDRGGVGGPAMERPCACGGTVRRKSPHGRWPARCGACKSGGTR